MTRGIREGDLVRVTQEGYVITGVVEMTGNSRHPDDGGRPMVAIRGTGEWQGRSQVCPAEWVRVLRHAPGRRRRR